uniref:uncharacterized protein isoform X1 n=2 Tax=Pristiophorus japonicus TaxID=55135 RepID=UPI00398E6999
MKRKPFSTWAATEAEVGSDPPKPQQLTEEEQEEKLQEEMNEECLGLHIPVDLHEEDDEAEANQGSSLLSSSESTPSLPPPRPSISTAVSPSSSIPSTSAETGPRGQLVRRSQVNLPAKADSSRDQEEWEVGEDVATSPQRQSRKRPRTEESWDPDPMSCRLKRHVLQEHERYAVISGNIMEAVSALREPMQQVAAALGHAVDPHVRARQDAVGASAFLEAHTAALVALGDRLEDTLNNGFQSLTNAVTQGFQDLVAAIRLAIQLKTGATIPGPRGRAVVAVQVPDTGDSQGNSTCQVSGLHPQTTMPVEHGRRDQATQVPAPEMQSAAAPCQELAAMSREHDYSLQHQEPTTSHLTGPEDNVRRSSRIVVRKARLGTRWDAHVLKE